MFARSQALAAAICAVVCVWYRCVSLCSCSARSVCACVYVCGVYWYANMCYQVVLGDRAPGVPCANGGSNVCLPARRCWPSHW